jgi:hypothetical protein
MRRGFRRSVAAWMASLAALGSSSASGQAPLARTESSRPVVLEGLVAAPDGAPAEDAVVVSSVGGQVVTDRDGRYRLEIGVPLGAESIEVTAAGGRSGNLLASTRVELGAGVQAVRVAPLELAAGTCQPRWLPTFGGQPGMNSSVEALAVFDDGNGPALYAGGEFTVAGGYPANRIAKWDGSRWVPLGFGFNAGASNSVLALVVFDDGSGPALYAGGQFTAVGGVLASRIAKWDGSSWSALGSGVDTFVRALAVFDDGSGPALYAGGDFFTAGGVPASRIAKWDGSTWSPLGSGVSSRVYALTNFDDGSGPALYAGGVFTIAGGVLVHSIAAWNGSSWSALGSGMNDTVHALSVFDDGGGAALYAGGSFTAAGVVPAASIAAWNGSGWSALGSGMNDTVHALSVFDDGGGPAL